MALYLEAIYLSFTKKLMVKYEYFVNQCGVVQVFSRSSERSECDSSGQVRRMGDVKA